MNKQEAVKLLALIKVAYPTAYRDMDQASKQATVNMWQMSFPDVPLAIMEQAFNHFRMVSKFPPTVAEMVEELKQIHAMATENALICSTMGDEERVKQYRAIMGCTFRYTNIDNFWGRMDTFPSMIGGVNDAQRLGTPGNNLGFENRLPLMDAGDQ